MQQRSLAIGLMGGLLGLLVLTGCPPKKKLAMQEEKTAKEETQEEAKMAGTVITPEWAEIPALLTVNFAYDSSALDQAARDILKKNVAVPKKLPASVTMRLEGHCDERGTIEYNIALGQKRANTVQSYYVTSGVAKARIETVSFGEERPFCSQQTEDCWAKNRRSVTKVRNSQPITVKADELE